MDIQNPATPPRRLNTLAKPLPLGFPASPLRTSPSSPTPLAQCAPLLRSQRSARATRASIPKSSASRRRGRSPRPAPAAYLASLQRFPSVPLVPLVPLSRARLPSSGYLPPPPLPAPPIRLRSPLHTSSPLRSPPVPHQPITAKRHPKNEPSEPSLMVRLRRTRSKTKGSVSATPPRLTLLSIEPQRVTPSSPSRPPSPSPLHPTASRRRPP